MLRKCGGADTVTSKVLKNGRGRGRGRVKVFTVSAVTDAALQIAVVAVRINHKIAQILKKLFIHV
jgi:hypothetical protein